MPAHWTYDEFPPEADLAQGDILEPNAALREVLKQAHPHFLDDKYIAFMVLTQSCDLVRRANYRGQHINLCVVRELSSVAITLLELYCRSEVSGVFRADKKLEAKRLFERIINQNEHAIGLFYLHPDSDAGISTPSVAMLRIGIALRAAHYDTMRSARKGRLRSEFQAKLGWLIGNLYSRVGTADWSEPPDRNRAQQKIIEQVFENLPNVVWASLPAIRQAKTNGYDAVGKTPEQMRDAMKSFEPPPQDQVLLQEIHRILGADDLEISDEVQQKIMKRLPNDARAATLFRKLRNL